MPSTTIERPTLRLAAKEGRGVSGPARNTKPLTDEQARESVEGHVRDAIGRLPRSSAFRRTLGHLLVELEYDDPDEA